MDSSGSYTPSSSLPIGAATETTLASIKDTDGIKKITDALPAGTNTIGKVNLNPGAAQFTGTSINAAASGDNTLVAGVGGQTVKVYKLFLIAAADVDIKFKDGAGTDLTGAMSLAANAGMVLDFDGSPWFTTSTGNGFILNLSAAVQVSGRIYSITS